MARRRHQPIATAPRRITFRERVQRRFEHFAEVVKRTYSMQIPTITTIRHSKSGRPMHLSSISRHIEKRFLVAVDLEREAHKQECARLQTALEAAVIALDDITCMLAPTMCNEARVAEATARIRKVGSLFYIATVVEQCNNTLNKKEDK